jgi:hypothetical protein
MPKRREFVCRTQASHPGPDHNHALCPAAALDKGSERAYRRCGRRRRELLDDLTSGVTWRHLKATNFIDHDCSMSIWSHGVSDGRFYRLQFDGANRSGDGSFNAPSVTALRRSTRRFRPGQS